MGRNYTPSELFAFLTGVLAEVADPQFDKYQKKLVNCYLNQSIKVIENDQVGLSQRFRVMVAMLSLEGQAGQLAPGAGDPEAQPSFAEVAADVLAYLTKKEIAKIRAVILDLHTNTYTEDREWSPRPEPWAVRITDELDAVLPPSAVPAIEQTTAQVHAQLLARLVQELRTIFISKAQPFGKKGNLLVVNLVYLQQYFAKKLRDTKLMADFIVEVQRNFKPGEAPEATETIRRLQLKK